MKVFSKRGLLGKEAIALYKALPVSDQGLTRERYLRLVEQVPQICGKGI